MLALAPIDTNKLKIITVLESLLWFALYALNSHFFFNFFFQEPDPSNRYDATQQNKTKQNRGRANHLDYE